MIGNDWETYCFNILPVLRQICFQFTFLYIYLPTPLAFVGCDFKGSTASLNSDLSFSYSNECTKI